MGTKTTITTTSRGVTCNHFREMISARIDEELEAGNEACLEDHLQTCASCLSYQDDAFALRRALRMRAIIPIDSSEDLRPTVDLVGSLRGVSILRWSLFVIGATLVVLNVQSVIFADGSSAAHLSRHDGVFGTALGIGMLAVAAKPHRAIGLVPLTSAIALLMAIVAAADLISGKATMLAEAVHVVQFAGLICLWVISGGPTRTQQRIDTVGHHVSTRKTSTVPEWLTK